jgi:hypothetical protein
MVLANGQDDIIRRWESANAVLRLVQVLSFIIRLCATVLSCCIVADLGWLLMAAGTGTWEMVSLLLGQVMRMFLLVVAEFGAIADILKYCLGCHLVGL